MKLDVKKLLMDICSQLRLSKERLLVVLPRTLKKALEHATDKNADVLVAYMKGNGHTQKSVEDGIRKFEQHNSKRFKQIIIVTENGKIHRHKHNP